MNFSRFLDLQSWWEVPSIAYFCSLFRTAFNLLDFDIEELEEALLTDGTEESGNSLLTELIVRLLNGCLGNNDISAFNYQMYLRRLFRRKCQETGRCNPFNTDIDFQFLPLRTKVEILYALCDFRLDAEDVFDLFKNLEAESLRVEPLGWDDNDSAYWYFYGTRLYREDLIRKPKGKTKKKKIKDNRKRGWFYGDDWLDDEEIERVWQVVCFTEEDWTHLTDKFSKASSKVEKELHRSLSQNFLPEIPRLFQEKERLQRKRLLESAPRRTSSRVLQKIKQKEDTKETSQEPKEEEERKESPDKARENRAKRRNLLRSKSVTSNSENSGVEEEVMPHKSTKQVKNHEKQSKNSSAMQKGEPPPDPPVKTGRKTNNSLASATGQILIPDNDEPVNSTRKKLKTSQIFSQTEEDVQTDMYKVLEQLTAHEDAWPFMDPVEEEYAPNYYAVIRRPMDLRKMEQRLDTGYYTDFSMFKADFKLIVNNCRLYNGQDNEYTTMVDNLQAAFDRLTEKYIHRLSSSDEEIAVEYQLPTPSRKHKLKTSESPNRQKKKKRKSHSDTGEHKSANSSNAEDDGNLEETISEIRHKKPKESHKNKEGKEKKKHKSHRHGKHSKNHKKDSHRSEHGESTKSRHSKKHAKNKDRESRKAKQKRKKNKHHEIETTEILKRTPSQESLESSNRSRSASPLPSIHTPTPSPTELHQVEISDQLNDSDFFKDKYDKIKERRRHAAKDAWESLFDHKQKPADKQISQAPEKEKNQKLRETIEKLKAKNEKYKDTSLFNSLLTPGHSQNSDKTTDKILSKQINEDLSDVELSAIQSSKGKSGSKKGQKKTKAKNESASEALEQAVKDISKWLDDAPKSSTLSSPCDSPAQTVSTEEHDNSRLDDDISQGEKSIQIKKDTLRKRQSSKEPKIVKRREIQRTIDRLQPGKGKGNLLTNMSNKNVEKTEEVSPLGPLNKSRDAYKGEETSPKLSLGSVLPTVEFSLGNDHNFTNDEVKNNTEIEKSVISTIPESKNDDKNVQQVIEKKEEIVTVHPNKKDAEVETDLPTTIKPSQEKATPNLSAWFKAFGAPKPTSTTTIVKKKVDDTEKSIDEKALENKTNENNHNLTSPKNTVKYDSPTDPETPNPDGGDSPLPNMSVTPRQRRTSTGSSVSERSSFSQDLDSPRHQMSHTSPLLRSPASPRTEDFQKITYPIINGTVRAGFYQDTTSMKSSPEKSCSPREGIQSPYSPYSQHVYASNNVLGSSTPNYFVDHSKSPLPTYTQNPPPYYDTSKAALVNKPSRVHDDYTALGPDTYPQNAYSGPFSPAQSPYSQSNYHTQSHPSPQPVTINRTSPQTNTPQILPDPKNTLFPVKKRVYNEPEIAVSTDCSKKLSDNKDSVLITQNKIMEYQKKSPSPQTVLSSLPTQSVDNIALSLSDKTDIPKSNNFRDKAATTFLERANIEKKDNNTTPDNTDESVVALLGKKDNSTMDVSNPINVSKKDNIDMVNMGYMTADHDRRNSGEVHEVDFSIAREISKPNMNTQQQQKGYEVEAIAINLGLNSQQMQKSLAKTTMNPNIPPAHSQDRTHIDININQNIAHAHHNQYEHINSGAPISNFSLNDIELANKKLHYACNTNVTATAIDYGNWKMSNQIRKQDLVSSDYPTNYSANNSDKHKTDLGNTNAINYNKNIQQSYNNYNVPRSTLQRPQELQQALSAEIRIPNPRGILKTDHISVVSPNTDNDVISKSIDSLPKSQKTDKLVQNHPLVGSLPYKAPYSSHSSIPLESLRNLPKIPQMLDRYANDERYLSSFAGTSSSLYHEKSFQMAQIFNKSISSDVHPTTSVNIYTQPSVSISKDNNSSYKTSNTLPVQSEPKSKPKRKRTTENKTAHINTQNYHTSPCTDVLSSVKTSIIPGTAFNFGTTTNMTLGGGLYGDNTGFSIEDFRNTTAANQLMAANYMAAAVAHQQRNNAEATAEKLVKPAHQNSAHSGSFPFISHTQARSGYPFVGADTSSPLYQQYLQRHQEELLRQTGAQIMGLYPPGYPAGLGVRQPYDSINRPSWL